MNALVLARYREDVRWWEGPPEGWVYHVMQNGDGVGSNGREHAAYLRWILREYFRLPFCGTVCFSQAEPLDHVGPLTLEDVGCFTPMNGITARTIASEPFDQFFALEWERLLGLPFPAGGVEFPAGSIFSVPASVILRRPRAFYEDLLSYVTQTSTFHGHVLERLWPGALDCPAPVG